MLKIFKHIGEFEQLDEEYFINIRCRIKPYIFISRSLIKSEKIYLINKERKYTWLDIKNFKFFTY